MTYLALPWFVLVTTGSASKMTLVLAAEILPMALFGIPSGTLVQKLGSRTVMLISDFARAPLLMSVPILHSAGVLSVPLLLGVVFALGCFMPPYFASQRTILPELVGEDERLMSQANSLIEGGGALAALLGPALAGILIPFLGAPNVLYVDAAMYVVSFLLIFAFVLRREPVAAPVEHGVLAGLSFLLRDRLFGPMALTVVAFGFLGSALSAALPVYAYDTFDGSAKIAGLFYTALGAGALVGTLFALAAVRKVPPLRLAALAILGFAAPMWLLPLGLAAWAVVVVLFVATAFTPLINGPTLAVLTARTPPDLRARVMTAVITVNTVAAPLGFIAAGQVLERWGVNPVFAGVAARK
jgi:MFS family permease